MRTQIVVGGGITGLLAACLLRRRDAHARVVLVENAPVLGGLLGKVDGGAFGTFDLGMHTLTETGIAGCDAFFRSLLPEDEWYEFRGEKRDVTGLFFEGRLQTHIQFPDLGSLPEATHRACVVDFFENLERHPEIVPTDDLRAFGENRFGPKITDAVLEPFARKTYGRPARDIHPMAAHLVPLGRVGFLGERAFQALISAPQVRARVAYPDQRKLPLEYASRAGSLYPRRFGIHRVIDALETRAGELGVEIRKSCRVAALEASRGRLEVVTLEDAEGKTRVSGDLELSWTTALPGLAHSLGVVPPGLELDTPRTTVVVNFLLREPRALADLYHFFCFDPRFAAYRVTHFTNYCPGAPRAGGQPVSIELVLDSKEAGTPAELAARGEAELRAFGVLGAGDTPLFRTATVLARGFPMLTTRNVRALDELRGRIREAAENVTLLGILSRTGLFLQTDILADTWRRLAEGAHAAD